MKNTRPTQCDKIIKYLQEFGSISQLEALQELGVMRLASRINELKNKGYEFKVSMIKSKNRWGEPIKFARYELKENNNEHN